MNNIKHKILVLSGKGGVGKSSVAVNLASWLVLKGKKVGLLDVDIHGPSSPSLLGLSGQRLQGRDDKILPVNYSDNLKVMSVGFMLNSNDDAVIWRGPMKHNVIAQFVQNVDWADLDYLVVDCPPGTGDEPLSVVQLIDDADGAVVVTTPQQIAVVDVRKCLSFCGKLNLPVLGIIENMSGFICPHCGEKTDIFQSDGGQKLATEFNVPFLGKIPLDPKMVIAAEQGKPFISKTENSPTAKALDDTFSPLLAKD